MKMGACRILGYFIYCVICLPTMTCGQNTLTKGGTTAGNDFTGYNASDVPTDMVQEYQKNCPSKPLCVTNTPTLKTKRTVGSCCGVCSCELSCYKRGTCCPDVLQFFDTENLAVVTETCFRPQYIPYGSTNISSEYSYYLTNKCPSGFDDKIIKQKCEHVPYAIETLVELLDIIPVTSGKHVYRNRYCAMCNGRPETHHATWFASLHCVSRKVVEFKSFQELINFVNSEITCNILFSTPGGIHYSPRGCDWGDYTRCNQTGNMVTYNRTLEDWCGAFTAMFRKQYRNVFCYMCNSDLDPLECIIDKNNDVNIVYGIPSFTAVLDFNSMKQEGYPASRDESGRSPPLEVCTSGQRYDNYKGLCRNLTCAGGFTYTNGACIRQYTRESSRAYQMYLRIASTSNESICVSDMDNFHDDIMDEIDSMFEEGSHLQTDVCSMALLYKSGQHTCTENSTAVDYVLVHIEISETTGSYSVDEDLDELFAFDGEEFEVDFFNKNQKTFETVELSCSITFANFGHFSFDSSFRTRNYTDPVTREPLIIIHPLYLSKSGCYSKFQDVTRVSSIINCPRVRLTSSEYPALEMNDAVCFIEINYCVQSGWFEPFEEVCDVCADSYFLHVRNMTYAHPARHTSPNECAAYSVSVLDAFNLTSLICTSVSMLFLLLTILTYSMFRSLRTTPGINNMLLSIHLFVAQGLFQFGMGQITIGIGCTVIGVLIHFFWLSAIVWMNICSLHMFRVFSTFGTTPSKQIKLYKYVVYAIIAPLIPVAANILVALSSSDWTDIGYGGCLCYISSPRMVLYTFALPVGVLVVINNILYIIVVVSIRRSGRAEKYSNHHRISNAVYMKLSCLTGGSWVFGFLYSWIGHDVLGYLFIILGAGQGFIIFLSFICTKRVLELYRKGCGQAGRKLNTRTTNYNPPQPPSHASTAESSVS